MELLGQGGGATRSDAPSHGVAPDQSLRLRDVSSRIRNECLDRWPRLWRMEWGGQDRGDEATGDGRRGYGGAWRRALPKWRERAFIGNVAGRCASESRFRSAQLHPALKRLGELMMDHELCQKERHRPIGVGEVRQLSAAAFPASVEPCGVEPVCRIFEAPRSAYCVRWTRPQYISDLSKRLLVTHYSRQRVAQPRVHETGRATRR